PMKNNALLGVLALAAGSLIAADTGPKEEVKNAAGKLAAKNNYSWIWVKDGVLAKYEFKVQGTMSFNGNDVDIDRTTTVEIKDVGSTKVELPDEAKKKVS